MKVLMVAAENGIIPGAKVGGIADVIRDIPVTLAKNNVKVDVIIPDHGLYHQKMTSELISTIQVSFRGELTEDSLYRIMLFIMKVLLEMAARYIVMIMIIVHLR